MTIPTRKTRNPNTHTNRPTQFTLRRIREDFIYFPDTGEVTRFRGKEGFEEVVSERPLRDSGATPVVFVNKQKLTVAAIAWYLHYRVFPHKTPKFIDGNKRNFRLVNLRYAY